MNDFFNLWPRITQRLLAVGGAAHSGAADPLASVFGNAKELEFDILGIQTRIIRNLTLLVFRRA
jgi:hypothetical protein